MTNDDRTPRRRTAVRLAARIAVAAALTTGALGITTGAATASTTVTVTTTGPADALELTNPTGPISGVPLPVDVQDPNDVFDWD